LEKDETQQLNVEIPIGLYRKVKVASLDRQLKLKSFINNALALSLYIEENALSWPQAKQVVSDSHALACLYAARNDLSHQGFDTSLLDGLIKEYGAFMERKFAPTKKRRELTGGEAPSSEVDGD
jgi:hypothetical protein